MPPSCALLKEEEGCVWMPLSFSFWEQAQNVLFQGNLPRNGLLPMLKNLPACVWLIVL